MDAATTRAREIDMRQRCRKGVRDGERDAMKLQPMPRPIQVERCPCFSFYGFDTTTGRRASWVCRRWRSAACERRNSAFLASEGVGGAALGSAVKRSAAAIAIPATK